MIGSKMVLTYKRKRLSSRPGLGFENECPDQSPGCQTLQVLKKPVTEEEEEDSKHEPERKDPETSEMVKTNLDQNSGCECNLRSVSEHTNHECSSEAVDLPLKGKSGNTCAETVKDNKPVFPLITFSRRFRHKKSVLEKDESMVANESQEMKTNEVVDLHEVHSLPVPKIETNEKPNGEGCILKDTLHIPAPTSAVNESLSESDGITTKNKREGGSLASFDLSKPPPESSGLVDCNLTLESNNNLSETHRDSTDSTSRSHSIVLQEFPCQGKVLELLDERIGETPLSRVHTGGPTGLSSSSYTWGPHLPSAPINQSQSQTSKTNFLQLFPEDRVKDSLKNPIQETSSFMHHEDKPSNRRHLHFRTSTTPFGLSPWPTIDTPGAHYPTDPVSLMRHKIMLDNIISKARIISGKNDNFDPQPLQTMWSEEELDFLWIGVRRHGIGNWDSMLRDPRLHFAYSRSPRELAERWEEEHSKLLITKSPPRTKRKEPPQLSLGVKGNLPHWLWEAVSVPPAVSYTGHSGMMQWINQPFSGPVGPELRAPGGARLRDVAVLDRRNGIGGGKADEVIVIESDASSEETISDDHSVRN